MARITPPYMATRRRVVRPSSGSMMNNVLSVPGSNPQNSSPRSSHSRTYGPVRKSRTWS